MEKRKVHKRNKALEYNRVYSIRYEIVVPHRLTLKAQEILKRTGDKPDLCMKDPCICDKCDMYSGVSREEFSFRACSTPDCDGVGMVGKSGWECVSCDEYYCDLCTMQGKEGADGYYCIDCEEFCSDDDDGRKKLARPRSNDECLCGLPLRNAIVVSDTANKGRPYSGCSLYPNEGHCDFFVWRDRGEDPS